MVSRDCGNCRYINKDEREALGKDVCLPCCNTSTSYYKPKRGPEAPIERMLGEAVRVTNSPAVFLQKLMRAPSRWTQVTTDPKTLPDVLPCLVSAGGAPFVTITDKVCLVGTWWRCLDSHDYPPQKAEDGELDEAI